jgi:hypothetical protein
VQILTKIFRRSSNKINKEYNITTFVSEISRNKASIVGRGILVRWLLLGTVSGRGNRKIIENYIKNQGREEDVKQLRLFDI